MYITNTHSIMEQMEYINSMIWNYNDWADNLYTVSWFLICHENFSKVKEKQIDW